MKKKLDKKIIIIIVLAIILIGIIVAYVVSVPQTINEQMSMELRERAQADVNEEEKTRHNNI